MTSYCTPSDLSTYSISAAALSGISNDTLQAACNRASEEADSYLRARFALPLRAWGTDITAKVADLATYYAIAARGLDPEVPANKLLWTNYQLAVAWFVQVSKRVVHPDVTEAASSAVSQEPLLYTSPQRGWSRRGRWI